MVAPASRDCHRGPGYAEDPQLRAPSSIFARRGIWAIWGGEVEVVEVSLVLTVLAGWAGPASDQPSECYLWRARVEGCEVPCVGHSSITIFLFVAGQFDYLVLPVEERRSTLGMVGVGNSVLFALPGVHTRVIAGRSRPPPRGGCAIRIPPHNWGFESSSFVAWPRQTIGLGGKPTSADFGGSRPEGTFISRVTAT